VSEGASAQGDFTVSWIALGMLYCLLESNMLGMLGREAEGGCARRVPQSPHVPSAEQSRESPRVPPMPECRFNKYNATSKKTKQAIKARSVSRNAVTNLDNHKALVDLIQKVRSNAHQQSKAQIQPTNNEKAREPHSPHTAGTGGRRKEEFFVISRTT